MAEGTDYLLEYENNVDAGKAIVTARGINGFYGVKQATYTIKKQDISSSEITLSQYEYVYDGTEKKPSLEVQYNDKILVEGIDYNVVYSDNIEVGRCSVMIIGIDLFTGSKVVTYDIIPISLENADCKLKETTYIYDGSAKTPYVYVMLEEKLLEQEKDYVCSYSNNVKRGIATVTINGVGNYSGTKELTFSIYVPIEKTKMKLSQLEYICDMTEKSPSIEITYGEEKLVEGVDYTLKYENNINVGVATVTAIGINGFDGTKQATYTIKKQDVSLFEISLSKTEYIYDGTEKKPDVKVKFYDKLLVEGKDYSITYGDTISAGVVPVIVTGIDLFEGSKTVTYNIAPISLGGAECKLKETIYTYDGSPKMPSVSVLLNDKELTQDKDYELSYRNNVDEGTAYAVIKGIGNYTDAIEMSFVILPYNSGMASVYEEGALIDGKFVYGITDDEKNEVEACCPAIKDISNVQIPATVTCDGVVYKVTSIGQKAFYKNTKITSLTIGNNVKSIEDYAFYGCKNMKTLKIGNGVEIVGNSAFRKCTKLTSVILPKSINELGKNAFYGCSKLKTVTINSNSVVDVSSNAIKGISKKAVIKVPKKLINKYKKEFNKSTGFKKTMMIKKK